MGNLGIWIGSGLSKFQRFAWPRRKLSANYLWVILVSLMVLGQQAQAGFYEFQSEYQHMSNAEKTGTFIWETGRALAVCSTTTLSMGIFGVAESFPLTSFLAQWFGVMIIDGVALRRADKPVESMSGHLLGGPTNWAVESLAQKLGLRRESRLEQRRALEAGYFATQTAEEWHEDFCKESVKRFRFMVGVDPYNGIQFD